MSEAGWVAPTQAQLQASAPLADATMTALTNERGIHAETAVMAIARMAGTFLFHSFNLPTDRIAVGAAVLSEVANERGPLLVHTLQAGLGGLDVEAGQPEADPLATNPPQLSLIETQRLLIPHLVPLAITNDFSHEEMAHACALATAIMIYRTRSVLDPSVAFGLSVYGFVEGSKTKALPL